MNIYDELLHDLHLNGYLPSSMVKKPLEKASKEHELLNLYRSWFMAKTTKEQDEITYKIVQREVEL